MTREEELQAQYESLLVQQNVISTQIHTVSSELRELNREALLNSIKGNVGKILIGEDNWGTASHIMLMGVDEPDKDGDVYVTYKDLNSVSDNLVEVYYTALEDFRPATEEELKELLMKFKEHPLYILSTL